MNTNNEAQNVEPRPLERSVRQWNQSGFVIVSKVIIEDKYLPMVHSFHTARWEAESEIDKLIKELPEHLRVELAINPAELKFDA